MATGTVELGEGGEVSKGEGEGEEGEGRTLSEVSSEEELLSSMTPTQRLIYQEQQVTMKIMLPQYCSSKYYPCPSSRTTDHVSHSYLDLRKITPPGGEEAPLGWGVEN